MNNILDSLCWRNDQQISVKVIIQETLEGVSMTAMDLISCGLFENDFAVLKSQEKSKIAKISQVHNDRKDRKDHIILYMSPMDAFNLSVSSGDLILLELTKFNPNAAEKVEIQWIGRISQEIILELKHSLSNGQIIQQGDLIEINYHGAFRISNH